LAASKDPEKQVMQMKKLTISVWALAALSLMMVSSGYAVNPNQLGIYTDASGDPATANFTATPNVPFMAYLVLTNPVNHSYDGGADTNEPITMVNGFECRVTMPSTNTFFVLDTTYPVQSLDLGAGPSHVVGFNANVMVTGNSLVLCTWEIMVTNTDTFNIFMGPSQFPSIAGKMAILDAGDAQDPLSAVYVSTGDTSIPVFSVNGTDAVAVDNESWGGVKALFR